MVIIAGAGRGLKGGSCRRRCGLGAGVSESTGYGAAARGGLAMELDASDSIS